MSGEQEKIILQKTIKLTAGHVLLSMHGIPVIFFACSEIKKQPDYLCFLEHSGHPRTWLVIPFRSDVVRRMVLREMDIPTAMKSSPVTFLVTQEADNTFTTVTVNTEEVEDRWYPKSGSLLYCDQEIAYLREILPEEEELLRKVDVTEALKDVVKDQKLLEEVLKRIETISPETERRQADTP